MRVLCSPLRVERTCSYCSSTTFSYDKFDGLSVSRGCKTEPSTRAMAPGAGGPDLRRFDTSITFIYDFPCALDDPTLLQA